MLKPTLRRTVASNPKMWDHSSAEQLENNSLYRMIMYLHIDSVSFPLCLGTDFFSFFLTLLGSFYLTYYEIQKTASLLDHDMVLITEYDLINPPCLVLKCKPWTFRGKNQNRHSCMRRFDGRFSSTILEWH